jgi:hypothetical protein
LTAFVEASSFPFDTSVTPASRRSGAMAAEVDAILECAAEVDGVRIARDKTEASLAAFFC